MKPRVKVFFKNTLIGWTNGYEQQKMVASPPRKEDKFPLQGT
jgi:hypothetical protein